MIIVGLAILDQNALKIFRILNQISHCFLSRHFKINYNINCLFFESLLIVYRNPVNLKLLMKLPVKLILKFLIKKIKLNFIKNDETRVE